MLSQICRHSLVGLAAVSILGCKCNCGQDQKAAGPTTQPAGVAPSTQTPPAAPPAVGDLKNLGTDWTSMFDGQSLGKWKSTEFGGEGEVKVKDGAIVMSMGNAMTGITWTGDYPVVDYEISLEAQRVTGSDFFCGLTVPVKQSHVTLILGGWGGSLVGISSIGGYDASENETTTSRTFENGRWYRVRMRVKDKKLEAWLDDEQIVDVDTEGKKLGVRFEVEPSRPLGVATYSTTGAIRNVRIRRLRWDELDQ